MALRIETFDNARGGNTLYKALTHPAAAPSGRALIGKLARHAPIAIYDAGGALEAFSAFYDLDQIEIDGVYVQQVARVGDVVLGRRTRPITELACYRARAVFVAVFDSERVVAQMRPYLPEGAEVFSLDALRVPADRLTNSRRYLDPLNFATNFAFFSRWRRPAHSAGHSELLVRIRSRPCQLLDDVVCRRRQVIGRMVPRL